MGVNTTNDAVAGDVIDEIKINQFNEAASGDWVPRDPTGPLAFPATDLAGNLGTSLYRWNTLFVKAINLDGKNIDPDLFAAPRNVMIEGTTRTTSAQPQLLEPNGATLDAIVDCTPTALRVDINGIEYMSVLDIPISGLTAAPAPSLLTQCLINDPGLTGTPDTRYLGEEGTIIPVDTMGATLAARVNQWVCLRVDATGEYLFGWLKSTTEITNVYRGFYFDSTLAPVVRNVLNNNDVLTLMELGWVFLFSNMVSTDVSYVSPIFAYDPPPTPVIGQYWYNLQTEEWNRWGGAGWAVNDTLLIGQLVMNNIACVGARTFDFRGQYGPENTIELEKFDDNNLKFSQPENQWHAELNAYGRLIEWRYKTLNWNMPADLEPPFIEANDTDYYVYVSQDGEQILSPEKYYDRPDLEGLYHPYNSWRCVGVVRNDGAGNFGGPSSFTNEIKTWMEVYKTARPLMDTTIGSNLGAQLVTDSGYMTALNLTNTVPTAGLQFYQDSTNTLKWFKIILPNGFYDRIWLHTDAGGAGRFVTFGIYRENESGAGGLIYQNNLAFTVTGQYIINIPPIRVNNEALIFAFYPNIIWGTRYVYNCNSLSVSTGHPLTNGGAAVGQAILIGGRSKFVYEIPTSTYATTLPSSLPLVASRFFNTDITPTANDRAPFVAFRRRP